MKYVPQGVRNPCGPPWRILQTLKSEVEITMAKEVLNLAAWSQAVRESSLKRLRLVSAGMRTGYQSLAQ